MTDAFTSWGCQLTAPQAVAAYRSACMGQGSYGSPVQLWSAAPSTSDCQFKNWIVMSLLTSMLQVNRNLRLSVSTRRIPLWPLPSGTKRPRSRIGDNDSDHFLIREPLGSPGPRALLYLACGYSFAHDRRRTPVSLSLFQLDCNQVMTLSG